MPSDPLTIIGEKLRTARESKGLTLDDISTATRINRRFLEDIERGVNPSVPRTYVRAFIRSYAREVGLPDEDIRLSPDSAEAVPPPRAPEPVEPAAPPDEAAPAPPPGEQTPESTRRRQRSMLLLLIILLILGMIVLIVWMRSDHLSRPTQEISFSDAVKEQEAKQSRSVPRADSTARAGALPFSPGPNDSLSLEGIATDSVFVRVTIDSARTIQRTLTPLYRVHWKAARRFQISLSNGSAVSFTLNRRKLGMLGPSKKPVKAVSISWETLKKLP